MKRVRSMSLAGLVLTVVLATTPAIAQSSSNPLDLRVGKLEKEMKAVQRTVFPQGIPVQPDLSSPPPTVTPAGTPASAPLVDLATRVEALEKSLATVTGSNEQNSYRIKQLEDALTKVETHLAVLEGSASQSSLPVGTSGMGPIQASPVAVTPTTTTAVSKSKPTAAVVGPKSAAKGPMKTDAGRQTAVAAIEMPATGDAVEDDYTYGFRLYTAKFYPEAQAKLKEFTAKYPPTNKRWSYAQNLLGRAYFDEGKPALASVAFYDNYQKAPRGERAADSLTWLGQSLIKLKKTTDACKVFDELNDVYAAKLTSDQKSRTAKGRADAKCAG